MANPINTLFASSLIALLQLNKVTTQVLVKTHQELAVLRDTVKSLDPTFWDVYEANLKTQEAKGPPFPPTIFELSQSIDEILEALRSI